MLGLFDACAQGEKGDGRVLGAAATFASRTCSARRLSYTADFMFDKG